MGKESKESIETKAQLAGKLVEINILAKESNLHFFFCVVCKENKSYREMDSVSCMCCGQGICKKCKARRD